MYKLWNEPWRHWKRKLIFFLSRCSSTDTDNSQDSRGPSFLLLYHFHKYSDIYLLATLHVGGLSHIFNRNACIYQTATWWDLPPYRITIWLIDDVMLIFVCLLDELILGFVTAIWHEKLVNSNSHWLPSLYYKRTD